MKKGKSIFFRLLLLVGFAIFFYPTISEYVNSITQSKAIVKYSEAIGQFEGIEIERIKKQAEEYNKKLAQEKNSLSRPDIVPGYEENLNPFNNGMMGSVIIDKINVNLPIYHGVNEGVIQVRVGHLPGSSLPIGGKGTHSVISTHSGLPSAKLFTDLNKLEIGDEFVLSILDEVLTYRVDQILTVLPNELESLKIEEGKDYVTMFTCTPYGINTHRILVRGERVPENSSEIQTIVAEKTAKDNIKMKRIKMLAIIGIFVIIIVTIVRDLIMIILKKKNK